MNIWLAYVSYPVTTAVYFERALRKKHNVTTIGPKLSEETIKSWNLESLHLPVTEQNIPTSNFPDLLEILNRVPKNNYPDLFLWIESAPGFYPVNIPKLDCPTASLLIDSHISLDIHLQWATQFQHNFIVHRQFVSEFHKKKMKNTYWLPVGCDSEIHSKRSNKKLFDVGFVGTLGHPETRRSILLNKINEQYPVNFRRCFWDKMAEHFSQSKIVFNNAIKNDLNMRLFEVLSTGSFLLTDRTPGSGQDEMFKDGEDLGIYEDENIIEKVKFYLEHENIRECIAANGQRIVHNAHTYTHRCEELLNVALGYKNSTPSAEEWRERSLNSDRIVTPANFPKPKIKSNMKSNRSFVIPVLDMSPASPFNIATLLADLENIPGDVIVIFNSVEMAEKLKDHPRINYYATMKHNVGVSRAWNIGLNISQTPVTFIINSDLHILPDTIDILEKSLYELPSAAIVGPQGSFFHFESAKDIQYFDKGSFNYPTEVDAVSGFLFAVKTEYFNSGILKFDNQYTPCYFEEWDTGIQCKAANLKSYVVPVKGYEHEWSGSIKALRTIKYLNKEETSGEILERNRKLFWNKWNEKKNLNLNKSALESLWINYAGKAAGNLISMNRTEEAIKIYNQIIQFYPDRIDILAKIGTLEYERDNLEEALKHFESVQKLNPEYKLPINNFEMSESKSTPAQVEQKFDEYYQNSRTDIQQIINKESKRILDVGCGGGSLGIELKKQLNAEVWGIEYIKDAAEIASGRLDRVITGKIEDAYNFLPAKYFDTIIFADVLEHLVDPWSVLKEVKKNLADNGEIIASIPNLRYWDVIKALLDGTWKYHEHGLLDSTHLRFFTLNTIRDLFAQAELKVKAILVNKTDVELPDGLLEVCNRAGINVSTLPEEARHFQYLIKAGK